MYADLTVSCKCKLSNIIVFMYIILDTFDCCFRIFCYCLKFKLYSPLLFYDFPVSTNLKWTVHYLNNVDSHCVALINYPHVCSSFIF